MENRICKNCGDPLTLGENWSASLKADRQYECKPCYARRKRPNAIRRKDDIRDHRCLDCSAVLVPNINWLAAQQRNYTNLCRVCQSVRGRAYHEQRLGRPLSKAGDRVRGKAQSEAHIRKRAEATAKTLAGSVRDCAECGGEFTPEAGPQIYCSRSCYDRVAHRRRQKYVSARVSPTAYVKLAELYGNVCGICGSAPGVAHSGKPRRLAVDHCHQTGAIRGLLCSRCNTAIGLLYDDPVRLQAAIRYLAQHQKEPTDYVGGEPRVVGGAAL